MSGFCYFDTKFHMEGTKLTYLGSLKCGDSSGRTAQWVKPLATDHYYDPGRLHSPNLELKSFPSNLTAETTH